MIATMAIGYVAAVGGLYGAQRYIVFDPDRVLHSSPANYPFPVYDISVAGERKQILHGWWVPAANPRAKVVLYLHGNDGNVSTGMDGIAPLRELGYSVFMIDYRGYGLSNGGFPSESGVYRDAQSAWDYLVRERGVNPADLIIYGHSLGGAIAIELALGHPDAAGLVVESSFTSVYDMAKLDTQYSAFPVGMFLTQRFDSIAKVGQLKLPVLYIHGTDDEIVPFSMGRALYRATPSARSFIAVPEARHENNGAVGGESLRTAIDQFVDGTTNGPQRLSTQLLEAR